MKYLIVFGITYMARIWSMKRIGLQLYLYRIGVIIYSVVLFVNLLDKNYGEIVPYEFRFWNEKRKLIIQYYSS